MASVDKSTSVAPTPYKTGWDFFWREKREEVHSGLPKGLSLEETKKELKRRLREAWASLPTSIKNGYEARVNSVSSSESYAAVTSESKGGTVGASTSGESNKSKTGPPAPCHAFFLGNSAKKGSAPAKENSPVENAIPKFNLDAGTSSSKRSQKRRATAGQKDKKETSKIPAPRQFTSIRDIGGGSGNGNGSSGSSSSRVSGNSDKSTKAGGDEGNIAAKANGGAAVWNHEFFMTKEQKQKFVAEKRVKQEEEEERKRLQEIEENERRQQEKMEEMKARRKQEAAVFAAKGSGVNEFFVESEKRIAKEKALVAEHYDTGDGADDERVETWATFPEVQSVGLVTPISLAKSSVDSSSKGAAGATIIVPERRALPSPTPADESNTPGGEICMVVDLVVEEADGGQCSLLDKLQGDARTSRESRGFSNYGESLAEFGSSGAALRGLASAFVECNVLGMDHTSAHAIYSRRAEVDAARERSEVKAVAKSAEIVDLVGEEEDECSELVLCSQAKVGCEGLHRPPTQVKEVLCGTSRTEKALVDLFQPLARGEMLGNEETKRELEQWLLGWAGKRAESKKDKSAHDKKKKKRCSYDSDSEDDDAEAHVLDNVAAVHGPSGSGKTALVYALAEQTGFNIIEIGASQLRSGPEINKQFQEAAKSHGLKLDASGASTPFSIAANAAKSPASKQKLNLILFDEADLEFEEDGGMYKAMQSLIKTTRTPIIVTAERLERRDSPLSFLRSVNAVDCPMQRPTAKQLGALVLSILEHSLGTGPHVPRSLPLVVMAASIAEMHAGDVRACLHSLQALVPSTLGDAKVLKALVQRDENGGESGTRSLSLASWLASARALPILMDHLGSECRAALESNSALVEAHLSLERKDDRDRTPKSPKYDALADLRFCAPLISDVSPHVGPRKGGHVVRVEGRHFLQRVYKNGAEESEEEGKNDGVVECLPLEVCIGATTLAQKDIVLLSDDILEIRVPILPPGLHIISVSLRVTSSTSLCSDVCGTSNAWIRVRAPPGKCDIRAFLTESTRTGSNSSRSSGGSLQLISDTRGSTTFEQSRRKSEYIDDSDEEESEEERRREKQENAARSKGRGKRTGGPKLVKSSQAKKARTSEDGSGIELNQSGKENGDDDGDVIIDDSDDNERHLGPPASSSGRKKRRVVTNSSDDENDEAGNSAEVEEKGNEKKTAEKEEMGNEMAVHNAEEEAPQSASQREQVRELASLLSSDAQKACMEGALEAIWDASVTSPFLRPVDDLQCPDYTQVVVRPLDLGTLRETIPYYDAPSGLWEFIADVRVVWSNCFEYNGDDALVSRHAKLLSTAFDMAMKRELEQALRSVVDVEDDSYVEHLSAEQALLLKTDIDAAAASLLPAGPSYEGIDVELLSEHGLCPAPLTQTTPKALRGYLVAAEAKRSTLRKRTNVYERWSSAGFECNDLESSPVDLFPCAGLADGPHGRAEAIGACAGLDYLSALLDNWSDADLFQTHASLAPTADGVLEHGLYSRSSAFATSLISTESSARMMERSLQRLEGSIEDQRLRSTAINALVSGMRSSESSQRAQKKSTESSLVQYLLAYGSREGGVAAGKSEIEGSDITSTEQGKEERGSEEEEEEEEEFDEYRLDASSRRLGHSCNSEMAVERAQSESTAAEWASIGDSLGAPSLRLPLQQHFYTQFVCKTLVPWYRFSGGKGPQRRVFDNACLESRVSREIALDAIPLMSAMLRADSQTPLAFSERTSRRSIASAGSQRYPYFYPKSNDMDLRDMELIIELGTTFRRNPHHLI